MERERMVREQIEARGVHDPRVLAAMLKIERHLFVPEEQRAYAYEDSPLPIGGDQTISQPYVVALMTELLEPREHHRVLEVGTGSGYQAAVLAEIVDQVYTVEIVELLGLYAKRILDDLGYENIHARIGDARLGWPEEAPFDRIIATAAPERVPQALIDQLADPGRMVIPVGEGYSQRLQILIKKNKKVRIEESIPVRFVPMTGQVQEGEGI